MNADEIGLLNKQREFRHKLEKQCKDIGWSLDDVFYSNIDFYVNPENRQFKWSGEGDQPLWVRKHIEKHGNLDGARLKPKIKTEPTDPRG